jgi:hypothetical protein
LTDQQASSFARDNAAFVLFALDHWQRFVLGTSIGLAIRIA